MRTFQRPIRKMCAWFHDWPRGGSSAPRAETRLHASHLTFSGALAISLFISGKTDFTIRPYDLLKIENRSSKIVPGKMLLYLEN